MFEFGVSFFDGSEMAACYLINAPSMDDARTWASLMSERKHNDTDIRVECVGAHQ